MKEWTRLLGRGRRELTRHKPRKALIELQQALELCPVEEKQELCRILYYLGVALNKLGFGGAALRTWNSGVKMVKRSSCARMLDRMSNDYGMIRNNSADEDYRAFHSIHLSRYLLSKGSRRFGSSAEKDMVNDVIQSSWEMLLESVELEDLSVSARLGLFREYVVVFPYLECPENWSCEEIVYDFRNNRRVSGDSLCNCGSGRDNMTCCGRILSEDELNSGLF